MLELLTSVPTPMLVLPGASVPTPMLALRTSVPTPMLSLRTSVPTPMLTPPAPGGGGGGPNTLVVIDPGRCSLQPPDQFVREVLAVLVGHKLHGLAHDVDRDSNARRALHAGVWFVLCRSESSSLVSMLFHIVLRWPKIGPTI